MAKIKSLEELQKIREQARKSLSLSAADGGAEDRIQVRVAMATCGIAAGAREVMDEFIEEFKRQHIDNVVVTQTGCMGYCYAEPTIELTVPGREPVIYGYVDRTKVHDIIDKTIKTGELLDGIINPANKPID